MDATELASELVAAARTAVYGERRISEIGVYGHRVCWVERDPGSGNHPLLTALPGSGPGPSGPGRDIRPESTLYGYGGGSWSALGGEMAYVNQAGEVCRITASGHCYVAARPVADGVTRAFGNLCMLPSGGVVAVREQPAGDREATHAIVIIDGERSAETVAAEGDDFYLSPQVSPDGRWLAYLTWNNPDLAWHGAELRVVPVAEGDAPARAFRPPGLPRAAVREISWLGDNELLVVAENDGYELWTVDPDGAVPPALIWRTAAELGTMPWEAGLRTVAETDGELAVLATADGIGQLWRVSRDGKARQVALPFTAYPRPSLCARDGKAYVVAASPGMFASLVEIDVRGGTWYTVRPTFTAPGQPPAVESRTLRNVTEDGADLQAIVSWPAESDPAARRCSRGVIFDCHSGPTDQALLMPTPLLWFLSTLGFAVAQVNYRGSTGFGQSFRDALGGRWGVLDVLDIMCVVKATDGLGPFDRVFLRGESAGGLTILGVAGRCQVAGVVSVHGAVDGSTLRSTTHKFEAGYVDWLLGDQEGCRDDTRSAGDGLTEDMISAIACPVLIVAGQDDKIVPVQQARELARVLRRNGGKVILKEFPGEGHGLSDPDALFQELMFEAAFYLSADTEIEK